MYLIRDKAIEGSHQLGNKVKENILLHYRTIRAEKTGKELRKKKNNKLKRKQLRITTISRVMSI